MSHVIDQIRHGSTREGTVLVAKLEADQASRATISRARKVLAARERADRERRSFRQ